mgnify:CR=1 FL=1
MPALDRSLSPPQLCFAFNSQATFCLLRVIVSMTSSLGWPRSEMPLHTPHKD